MVDGQTIRFYETHADELSGHYNAIHPAFLERVRELAVPGGRVLDIGCGSGRDLAAFHEAGMEVIGIEPVAAFRTAAEAVYPELRGKIHKGSLPDDVPAGLGTFELIHCSAVLMHMKPGQLSGVINTFTGLLHPDGLIHLSFCPERPGVDAENRAPEGRLFSPVDPEIVAQLLERADFEILDRRIKEDAMERPGIHWVSIIAKRTSGK